MNYPYGEHFIYSDCQIILIIIIKALSKVFPGILSYNIGIFNSIIILSFIVSAVVIWLVLNKFINNYWYNAFCAFAITVLSPQIFRITGHFSLSFSWFIPVALYLLIRVNEDLRKFKWSIILSVYNLFVLFIHPYLGVISILFILSFLLFKFIYKIKEIRSIRKIFNIIVITIIPIILFNLFVLLTDKHVGRTTNPSGFLKYTSNFSSVFFPSHEPLNKIFLGIFNYEQSWEGLAYIGQISIIAIILFITILIFQFVKFRKIEFNNKFLPDEKLKFLIFGSIIILFFSMGYPFKWFPSVADKISILKQFRSTGRFAWVFYYIITISSVYFLYNLGNYFLNNKRKIIAGIFFTLPIFYIIEGIPYHKEASGQVALSPNLFNKSQLNFLYSDAIKKIDFDKYQAIIPLPFFTTGSECYLIDGTEKSIKQNSIFSYYSGLPLLGSCLSRTSIIETKRIIQILSPSFYEKPIIKDIKSSKPFLVFFTKEDLNDYEKDLLNKCLIISENQDFAVYSISKETLFENTSVSEIEAFNKIKKSLKSKNGFLVNDTNGFFYFNGFETMPSDTAFQGEGALKGKIKDFNCLVDIGSNKLKLDKEYIVSFWMYNWGDNYGQDMLNSMVIIQEDDVNGGNVNWIKIENPRNSRVINDKWSLVEVKFKTTNENKNIGIWLKGPDKINKTIYIDNVMVKEVNNSVYKIIKTKNNKILELFKNNHQIKI